MANEHPDIRFPCRSLPDEPAAARLLGLYPQCQDGLWMQRLRVPGGRLEPSQWKILAEIARRLTPGEPLHLTTRQDVEIHGLTPETAPLAQASAAEVGLTGLGACGDTVRNVTVCPCSGLAPGLPDLDELAVELVRTLQSQPGAFALPRKFKISLSACPEACGQPWINDLGFVARPEAGVWRFQAVVAGSLGAKPLTGMPWGAWLSAEEVLPFAVAALSVFAAHGDRENRHRARLRHVRQRLGDAVFTETLAAEFDRVRRERTWPAVRLRAPTAGFPHRKVVAFPNGDVTADAAEALGRLAGREDLRLRITNRHQVILFGRRPAALETAAGEASLAPAAGPAVVACPGTRWCARGLASTRELADRLRRELAGANEDLLIALSGCPNGCAQSAVADIGAIGVVDGSSGRRREAWNLLAGGDGGRGPGLARAVASRLSQDDAIRQIVELAAWLRRDDRAGKEIP